MLAAQIAKTCCTCRTPKPPTFFARDKSRNDGRHARCKACVKVYNDANRERNAVKQREWHKRFPERSTQSHKDYAYRRFFYIRANNLKLRHKDAVATTIEIARLWRFQRGRCAVSLRRLTRSNAHLDHILAIVNGGSGKIENLRWVHRDVNYAKRDLSDQAFLQLCEEVVAANSMKGVVVI